MTLRTLTISLPASPARSKHLLDSRLAPRYEQGRLVPTRIALVGAGGNGSQMVTCLARMDRALRSLGLPPLSVTLYDPDRVSQSNVGRQLFYPDDVGQSKAILLIHRANLGFGLDWCAVPQRYAPDLSSSDALARNSLPYNTVLPDILITCVDTGAARKEIEHWLWGRGDAPAYWLDIANEDETGQVWLGQFPRGQNIAPDNQRLPLITEAFPMFFDTGRADYVPESDNPTCSLAEALQSQDLFINDHCARWGAELLWKLLRYGEIEHHGYWVNLRDGRVEPVPVTLKEATTKLDGQEASTDARDL